MKKKFWILLICFATVIGCRKISNENEIGGKQAIRQDIERFLAAKMDLMNQTRRDKVDDMINKMDFGKIAVEGYSRNTKVVSVPVSDVDVHAFLSFLSVKASVRVNSDQPIKKKEKNRVTKVLFFELDGELTDVNIVEVSSTELSEEMLNRDFIQIVKNEMPLFNGEVNVNSIDKIPSTNWTFDQGKVTSSTVLKRGGPANNGQIALMQTCTDWYWVTTYHWSDGTISQTWAYVGTTCRDEENFPPNTDSDGTPPDTLCAQSKRLAANFPFKNAITDLKNRMGEPYENGYAQYGNSFSFVAGSSAGVSLAGLSTGIDGFYHNHLSGLEQTFSLVDIAQLYQALALPGHINMSTFTLGVVLSDGRVQLARISDPSAFMTFGNANLSSNNFPSFENSVKPLFTNASTVDQRTAATIKAFNSAGLTFYEGNASSLSQGFQRIDASTNATLEIIRTKCNN